jgi:serine/threonine-protein kinase
MAGRSDIDAAKAFLKLAVDKGLVSPEQARRAFLEAEKARSDPSEILFARGLITAKTTAALRRSVEQQLGAKLIGGHRVLSRLGRGGMGVVYRAEQKELTREVALKVMDEALGRDEPGTAQRFLREAKTMARVKDDHVVTVFDAGIHANQAFIVMELVEGGDAERMRRQQGGRLPPKRALEIVRDAALGVQAIHEVGLVHRDIKPANIFLTTRGKAKLADLGLSRDIVSAGGSTTITGTVRGTPAFMSPEQARDAPIDVRTDIYALGATLYTLVTGRAPYVGNNGVAVAMQAISGPFPDPLAVVPNLPAPVVALIARCTRMDPAARYQTPKELVAAVEQALADPALTRPLPVAETATDATLALEPVAEPWPESPPPARPLAPLVALVAALAVVAIALTWWALAPAPTPVPPPAAAPAVFTGKPTVVDGGMTADGTVPAWSSGHGGANTGYWSKLTIGKDSSIFWRIPAGVFTMGSPPDEDGRGPDESAHRVTITHSFWLGATPVTQDLWREVMANNPSKVTFDPNLPVEQVRWDDAQHFLAALGKRCPGLHPRLPTEAEWEYAARAETTGPWPTDLPRIAWFAATANGDQHPVGQLQANPWGLCDMHGNVRQWCSDWYGAYAGDATDPPGPVSGTERVLRGGCASDAAADCRSAARHHAPPDQVGAYIGLRIVIPYDGG